MSTRDVVANVKDSVTTAAAATNIVILVFIEVELRERAMKVDYGLGSVPLPPPLYSEGVISSSVQEVIVNDAASDKRAIAISFFMDVSVLKSDKKLKIDLM